MELTGGICRAADAETIEKRMMLEQAPAACARQYADFSS